MYKINVSNWWLSRYLAITTQFPVLDLFHVIKSNYKKGHIFMSSQATNNNARTKFYIHCAIMFALMFIVSKLPPFGDITPLGMQVLGIFAGVVYAWCFRIPLAQLIGYDFAGLHRILYSKRIVLRRYGE